MRAAETAVTTSGEEFRISADAWVASLPAGVAAHIDVAPALGERALDAVLAAGIDAGASEGAVRQLVDGLCAPARASIGRQGAAVRAEIHRLKGRRENLSSDRARIADEHDDAPPAAPGRPVQRPEGCSPLWACVDFAPSVGDNERAALEAALHAAGVLDALVTREGELLDPTTLDSVIAVSFGASADAPTRSLTEWIVPDPAGPQTMSAVQVALHAIGAGATSRATTWIDVDGRWANGALTGRWSKEQADYIGASARAAARARRIDAIDAEIANIDSSITELTAKAEELDALAASIDAAAHAFPSPAAVRDALRDEVRASAELGRSTDLAGHEHEHLAGARSRAGRTRQRLVNAEEAARCQAAGVDETLALLSQWMEAVVDAVGTISAAHRERRSANQATTTADELRARAIQSKKSAERDRRHADERRGEADELRRTEGADVEAILTRKAELESAQGAAVERQAALLVRRDEVRDALKAAETRLDVTEAERVRSEQDRVDCLSAMSRLATTELGMLAMGAVDPDKDLTQVTAGLAFARVAADRLRDIATDQRAQDGTTNSLHESFNHLRARLGADFDPHLDTSEGVQLCFAKLNGISVGATALATALDEQIRRRREHLSADERELIEQHLLAEVGGHLGERVHAAWSHVRRMNEQLAEHPTGSGVTLQLRWEADPEAGPGAVEGLRLLKRDVHLLDATERAALGAFLAERVRAARDSADGADTAERMAGALDYRRWHRFTVVRRAGGREERFTSRTQARGSGGEQAKLAHLPLFAATAGYYASAAETAPRLLILDEAFAGIDDSQRADCMGMLVELELDAVLTNYAEWGCYPEVPSVAIYHLEHIDGQRGVAALRFVWDGSRRREEDPFLRSLEPGERSDGLFATT